MLNLPMTDYFESIDRLQRRLESAERLQLTINGLMSDMAAFVEGLAARGHPVVSFIRENASSTAHINLGSKQLRVAFDAKADGKHLIGEACFHVLPPIPEPKPIELALLTFSHHGVLLNFRSNGCRYEITNTTSFREVFVKVMNDALEVSFNARHDSQPT